MRLQVSRRSAASGFTLIEVVLALAIAAGMLTVVLFFYAKAERLRNDLLREASRISAARLILDRLTAELNTAQGCRSFPEGLRGDSRQVKFARPDLPALASGSNSMSEASGAAPSVYRLMTYGLGGSGVARTEERMAGPAPVPSAADSGAEPGGLAMNETNEWTVEQTEGRATAPRLELAADLLRFARFRYWDGQGWVDAWSGPAPPAAVEIVLGGEPLPEGLTSEEYPFEYYRRVVYLPGHRARLTGTEGAPDTEPGMEEPPGGAP